MSKLIVLKSEGPGVRVRILVEVEKVGSKSIAGALAELDALAADARAALLREGPGPTIRSAGAPGARAPSPVGSLSPRPSGSLDEDP